MYQSSRKTGILLVVAALSMSCFSAYAANHAVSVGTGGSLVYTPADLSIAAGDTVTFTSVNGFHNAVSSPGATTTFRCANGCDGTGGNGDPAASGWVAVVTFPTPGNSPYFCEVHGQIMSGIIRVTVPVSLQTFEIE